MTTAADKVSELMIADVVTFGPENVVREAIEARIDRKRRLRRGREGAAGLGHIHERDARAAPPRRTLFAEQETNGRSLIVATLGRVDAEDRRTRRR